MADKLSNIVSFFIDNTSFDRRSLLVCLASVTLKPAIWNIIARNEYRNKTLTRLFNNNPRHGCYFLTFLVLFFGIIRDSLYYQALVDQPTVPLLPEPYATCVPVVILFLGQLLVISSSWALGITGTFLGDYFGILMDQRVTGFPFNILDNPMYVGTTLSFVATALWLEKPAGLLLTIYIWMVYTVVLRFEEPFTSMIYEKRAGETAKKAA